MTTHRHYEVEAHQDDGTWRTIVGRIFGTADEAQEWIDLFSHKYRDDARDYRVVEIVTTRTVVEKESGNVLREAEGGV